MCQVAKNWTKEHAIRSHWPRLLHYTITTHRNRKHFFVICMCSWLWITPEHSITLKIDILSTKTHLFLIVVGALNLHRGISDPFRGVSDEEVAHHGRIVQAVVQRIRVLDIFGPENDTAFLGERLSFEMLFYFSLAFKNVTSFISVMILILENLILRLFLLLWRWFLNHKIRGLAAFRNSYDLFWRVQSVI